MHQNIITAVLSPILKTDDERLTHSRKINLLVCIKGQTDMTCATLYILSIKYYVTLVLSLLMMMMMKLPILNNSLHCTIQPDPKNRQSKRLNYLITYFT